MRFLLLFLLSFGVAHADERSQAELDRYVEDMNGLVERQQWVGVERQYAKIMEMKGVDIPRSVHVTAAMAARERGDIAQMVARLERAQELEKDEETTRWLNELSEQFSYVELRSVPPRSVTLEPGLMPFAPDQRKAVELATLSLDQNGEFVGMLPVGMYTLQGVSFEVTAGVTARVELSSKDMDR